MSHKPLVMSEDAHRASPSNDPEDPAVQRVKALLSQRLLEATSLQQQALSSVGSAAWKIGAHLRLFLHQTAFLDALSDSDLVAVVVGDVDIEALIRTMTAR